jgi:hypothetical protein
MQGMDPLDKNLARIRLALFPESLRTHRPSESPSPTASVGGLNRGQVFQRLMFWRSR